MKWYRKRNRYEGFGADADLSDGIAIMKIANHQKLLPSEKRYAGSGMFIISANRWQKLL